MRNFSIAAMVAVVGVLAAVLALGVVGVPPDSASAGGQQQGYTRLEGAQATFLPAHFDQRTGTFDSESAGFFDDGADTLLTGQIPGIGRAKVETSAAWDWDTYLANHPSALVYNKAITMPRDHQHAGCKETIAGTHTFTATVKVTSNNGSVINADIVGGSNTERLIFTAAAHSPTCVARGGVVIGSSPPPFDGIHDETENQVTLVFRITGGTGDFAGATGDGVVVYVYNTKEPHELLDAGIILNLTLP